MLKCFPAGQKAARQGLLSQAASHLSQAGPYGWLPLTAAYLQANQLQPALLLLQHAIAQSYSPATLPFPHHSSGAGVAALGHGSSMTVLSNGSISGDKPQADDSKDASSKLQQAAAQQLAGQWAQLVQNLIEEANRGTALTLLLFPVASIRQLGTAQVWHLVHPRQPAPAVQGLSQVCLRSFIAAIFLHVSKH